MTTQTRPVAPDSGAETPGFRPFVPPSQAPAELTPRALVLGAVLGIVFAASSVYLALKIGLTVSASIPIAVLSVAFRNQRLQKTGPGRMTSQPGFHNTRRRRSSAG